MQRLILTGLLVALALPAGAARRVTVMQLDEILAGDDAVRRGDLDVSRQIGDFEMSERLTGATLDRFAATHKLGPRTALALQLLADQSAFLDPPSGELPSTASPDASTEQRMLEAARAYSAQTWSRMPNFFVTRVTNRFDDNLHALAQGDWPTDLKLQPAGSSRREVTFRDGKEVEDSPTGSEAAAKKGGEEVGLRSWGEFGSALTVVMADTVKSALTFSHWESTATGLAAVFRYQVPREASHYAVVSGYGSETIIGRTQFGYSGRDRSPQQVANIPRERNYQTHTDLPAYHGTVSIDPDTGAVMRLTVVAELKGDDPLISAETMVEYGPVQIGDRRFICPLHSLAISRERAGPGPAGDGPSAWGGTIARPGKSTTLLINETGFVDYHRLGSSSRILTDQASAAPGEAPPPAPAAAASPAMPGTTPASAPAEAAAAPAPPVEAPPAATPSRATPPPEPAIPEVSMTAASSVPDRPVPEPSGGDSEFSLKVTSRLVDVGLVAYDKKGRPVTDLKPAEIELYDNGNKQEIRSFSLAAGPPAAAAETAAQAREQPAAAPPSEEKSFANRAPEAASGAPAPAVSEVGSTVLVLDESHIAWNDLNYVRGQILKFLGSVAPGERVGIYTMTGLGFRVLAEVTTDHQALAARMGKFMPSAQSMAEAQEEETRNRQHFDEVHNVADLNSVNGNHIDVPDADQPVDPQLLTMGDNPARASFLILAQVARHLSAIPGQKKLIWVASDNVLADWRDQAVGIDKSPKDVSVYAMRAQEALNEAHTAIYPFDVSQLEGGAISADLEHQNVQLNQAAQENASLGGGPSTSRSTSPGRIDAAMSQDLHPVEGPVRQVAAATGGRVIPRSSDLSGQLERIVDDGHATYMLSFSPPGPADGQYHTITLKLAGRRGLVLSYRTGYVFEKEPATLRERFQQAVWRPADVSEIAVSASVARVSGSANLDVRIAAGDLGIREQADRWMDKLDIFLVQRDDAGLHARLEGQTLGLRLKSSTYQRLLTDGVPFERSVQIQPGMASLRVLVVDENSGRMGSVTIPAAAMGQGQ